MLSHVDKNALNRYVQAYRASDHLATMRIITENLERSEGVERAYWLMQRASCRGLIGGHAANAGVSKADYDEALRLTQNDVQSQLAPYFDRALTLQQVAPLREIPRELRVRIWKDGLWHRPGFWLTASHFHWWRRRWYQAFRAHSRAMERLALLPPDEYRHFEGWNYVYYCGRARAGLRCGRLGQVAEDVQKARAMTETRTHLHPWHLAMAEGELALHRGEYTQALGAIHGCLAHLGDRQFVRLYPVQQVELDLLAARVARAQGNPAGFERFCEKALAVCVEQPLPMMEVHVRAVMAGEPY